MNRSALVAGPCKIGFSSATLFSKDDVNIKIDQQTFDIRTSAHGKVAERVRDVQAVASVTPEGRWDAATIAALFPYTNTAAGTSLYTDVDNPCVITSAAAVHTLIAAAITKMPNVKFSAVNTLVEAAEITGLRGNDLDWPDADSLMTIGAGASIADAAFDPALIKTQPYTLDFGAVTGLTDVDSEEGFVLETNIETQDIVIDRIGIADKKLISVSAMVKVKPVGPSAANILAALKVQDTGALRGRTLGGTLLTITGADSVVYLTIPSCDLKTGGFRFGTTVLRNDEIAFVAARTFTAGAQNALFTLAAS